MFEEIGLQWDLDQLENVIVGHQLRSALTNGNHQYNSEPKVAEL